MVIDEDVNVNDCSNESTIGNMSSLNNSTSTPPTSSTNELISNSNKRISTLQQSFSPDYNGPIIVLVESINDNTNLGNWHPIKTAKFFSNNFTGIINIKPAGSKKIKITFDSIINGNTCLNSSILNENNYKAIIPSTLIFSYGIIKLDNAISEAEFFEGVRSPITIDAFKRINIKKDGNVIQTRIVELKFVAPKIPSNITVFNMIFEVKPSVRSPVQCNRCLRFGHTLKFCRSDPRCSHCGESKHSIDTCPYVQSTDPVCLFCKLPHRATDRSCQEWATQKDLKKIMATENISYKDALIFKKNNCYSTAFTFSDVVKSQSPISDFSKPNTILEANNFPSLTENHHFFNSRKTKQKPRSPSHINKINIPVEPQYSSPNGSYFKNLPNQDHTLENNTDDLSWVHTLSLKLSESLINSPSLFSPFSPDSLQSLIESSLNSLLNLPNSKFNSE